MTRITYTVLVTGTDREGIEVSEPLAKEEARRYLGGGDVELTETRVRQRPSTVGGGPRAGYEAEFVYSNRG